MSHRSKDGTELDAGKKIEMTRGDNHCRLTLRDVTSTDAGEYSCSITGEADSASCSAKLKVKGQATFQSGGGCLLFVPQLSVICHKRTLSFSRRLTK